MRFLLGAFLAFGVHAEGFDQDFLDFAFERGIDPYVLNEAMQSINRDEEKIQACLKKRDRRTCIGCCDASFGFLEPDKKRACKKRCHEQWPPDEVSF